MIAYIYIILLFILTSGEVSFQMAIVLFLTALKHMLIGVKTRYINGKMVMEAGVFRLTQIYEKEAFHK